MKANKDKIVTTTAHKVIIRWERLKEALSPTEVEQINALLDKVLAYDKSK